MPGLIGAWRVICRRIARRQTSGATGPDTCRTDDVPRDSKLMAIMRTVGTRMHAFLKPAGHRMQRVRANRILPSLAPLPEQPRANRRALVLMLKLLSCEQRREFRQSGYFHVTGGKSHVRYRIRTDKVANIDVLDDDGLVVSRLCVIPTGGVPVYDVMAAQLLHLQDPAAEEELLHKANVFYHVRSRSTWIA